MAKNLIPVINGTVVNTPDYLAVTTPAAQFANITTMASGEYYLYTCNVGSWIKQGTNPTASAAAGSLFVPANTPVIIDGGHGVKLSAIYDGVAGKASLARLKMV